MLAATVSREAENLSEAGGGEQNPFRQSPLRCNSAGRHPAPAHPCRHSRPGLQHCVLGVLPGPVGISQIPKKPLLVRQLFGHITVTRVEHATPGAVALGERGSFVSSGVGAGNGPACPGGSERAGLWEKSCRTLDLNATVPAGAGGQHRKSTH